jgi:hypothetical protein
MENGQESLAGLNGAKIRVLPVATLTQAGSLCYTNTVAWGRWARGTPPREAFRQIARHSGEQCSIGFQPVSGFRARATDGTLHSPNRLSSDDGPYRATFQFPAVEGGVARA